MWPQSLHIGMNQMEKLRRDIEDEIEAFIDSVDELESTVSEVETTVTASKLHDKDGAARDVSGRKPAAD